MQGIELARSLVKDFNEEDYILEDKDGNKLLIDSYTIEAGNREETRKVTYTFENSDEIRTLEYPHISQKQIENRFFNGEAINIDYCFLDNIDFYFDENYDYGDLKICNISFNYAFVDKCISIGADTDANVTISMENSIIEKFYFDSDDRELNSFILHANNTTHIRECEVWPYCCDTSDITVLNMKNSYFKNGFSGLRSISSISAYFDNSIIRGEAIDLQHSSLHEGIMSFVGCDFDECYLTFSQGSIGCDLDFDSSTYTCARLSFYMADLGGNSIKFHNMNLSNTELDLSETEISDAKISFDGSNIINYKIDIGDSMIKNVHIDLDKATGENVAITVSSSLHDFVKKNNPVTVSNEVLEYIYDDANIFDYGVFNVNIEDDVENDKKRVTYTLLENSNTVVEYPIIKWDSIKEKLLNNEPINIDGYYIDELRFDEIKDQVSKMNITIKNSFINSLIAMNECDIDTLDLKLVCTYCNQLSMNNSNIKNINISLEEYDNDDYTLNVTNNNIQNINTMFDNTTSNRFRIRTQLYDCVQVGKIFKKIIT